jgi:hypothetical protein
MYLNSDGTFAGRASTTMRTAPADVGVAVAGELAVAAMVGVGDAWIVAVPSGEGVGATVVLGAVAPGNAEQATEPMSAMTRSRRIRLS